MASVRLKLGPADHGHPLTLDEFDDADFEPGFKYELIDGGLYVAPAPNPPENRLDTWLLLELAWYARSHPEVLNYVTPKSRVFVRGRKGVTAPEPDIACYADLDTTRPFDAWSWRDMSPVLVVEVLVEGDTRKDLGRNVELYLDVPSVREYWVLDGRGNPNEPTLIQHRRHGKRWVVRAHPFGSTFTPKLLPGFSLLIDPHK